MDSEIFKIFRIPRFILTALGLWTTKDTSIFYKLYGVIMHLIFLDMYSVLMGMYLTQFETITDFAELLSIWPIYVSAAIKFVNFMARIDEIEELFVMLKECIDEFQINERFRKNLRLVDIFYKTFWGGATGIVVNMVFVNIFFHKLGLKQWFPYELDTPLKFWSAAIYQNFDGLCYAAANMTIDTLVVFFMCYIMGLLELLCEELENLKLESESVAETSLVDPAVKPQPDVRRSKEKFLKCIKSHVKIVKMTKKVEELFSAFMFIEGIFGVLVICTTAFVLTIISPTTQTVAFIQNICMMMTWLLQILMPCYYSQKITTLSEDLSTALFHSEWMYQDREYRKMMVFFMENTKKPLKISALGVFPVNLETFMRIVNSAYSMYAIFKRSS